MVVHEEITTKTRLPSALVDLIPARGSKGLDERGFKVPRIGRLGAWARDTGESGHYAYGGELCPKHRMRFQTDEEFLKRAREAGHEMTRESSITLHEALCPKDIRYKKRGLRNCTYIPSVGARIRMKQAEEFGFFMVTQFNRDESGRSLRADARTKRERAPKAVYHAVLAALPEPVQFMDACYKEDIQAAREAFTKVKDKLARRHPDFEVLMLREEEVINEMKWSVYVHFHIVIAGPANDFRRAAFKRSLDELWSAYSYVDPEATWDVQALGSYLAKPAYIPEHLTPEELDWFLTHNRGRQKLVRYGSFAKWYQRYKASKQSIIKINGVYTLVDPKRDDSVVTTETSNLLQVDEDGEVIDPYDDGSGPESAVEASSDAVATKEPETLVEATERAKANDRMAFCTVTVPRLQPDGRKSGYIVMSNYTDNPSSKSDTVELQMMESMAFRAREAWKRNTGQDFDPENEEDLRAWLEPRAEALWKRWTDTDSFYRDTIILSQRVIGLLKEILNKEDPHIENRDLKKIPPGECPF